ncbi:Twin-arginine translocation protein TatB [Pseudoalteromonas luteoviolacea B = ATCC 29581]|nr:Twin-arginine translocation protein TatB [Pseudoalteromonas luteoviolacea B = ATCC 29581]
MGFWELVVIFVVGLIVLGPERMPVAIRTVTRWIRTVKSYANAVKAEVNEELRVHELHNNLKKAERQGMENLSPEIQQSVSELQKAADSVRHSYQKPTDTPKDNERS